MLSEFWRWGAGFSGWSMLGWIIRKERGKMNRRKSGSSGDGAVLLWRRISKMKKLKDDLRK